MAVVFLPGIKVDILGGSAQGTWNIKKFCSSAGYAITPLASLSRVKVCESLDITMVLM